jgi:hypothetical protein
MNTVTLRQVRLITESLINDFASPRTPMFKGQWNHYATEGFV